MGLICVDLGIADVGAILLAKLHFAANMLEGDYSDTRLPLSRSSIFHCVSQSI